MLIKVLGVDPALRNMGIVRATIDTDTCEIACEKLTLFKTEANKKTAKVVRKNSDDLDRAKILHDALQKEVKEHGAKFVFVEVPVGSQSARAMASYGVCIGVLASCPVPMIQLTPTEVKKASVGSNTASKEEIIQWACDKYPKLNWLRKSGRVIADNEHLADAVATLHAGIESDQFIQMLSMWSALAEAA